MTDVLLSACLIVKDEEAMLGDCLASIAALVDEIVVYDTGSTDRTKEIARAAGARVVEGYWDHDFSRARNAALEHARGEWVLTIDADETAVCDVEQVRATLANPNSSVETFIIAIENLEGGSGAGLIHTAVRVARRSNARWVSRLHERLVAADEPTRELNTGYLNCLRLVHRGYLPEVFAAKNKAERNIETARAELDGEEEKNPYAMLNYARSLTLAGRMDEAEEVLHEVAGLGVEGSTRRVTASTLIMIQLGAGRYDDAMEQVAILREASVSSIAADVAESKILVARGRYEEALDILARVPRRGRDDDAGEIGAHMLAALRATALAGVERFGEAADAVLDVVRTDGVLDVNLAELVVWMRRAGRSPSSIARFLDVSDLVPILGLVLRLEPTDADDILEGAFDAFPERLEVLAAAGQVAPRLAIDRALVWSSRLRHRGIADQCPLVAIARSETIEPRTRILAAAAAYRAFEERGVVAALHDARGRLDPSSLAEADEQVERLAPGLLRAAPLSMATSEHAPVVTSTAPPRGRVPRNRAMAVSARERPVFGGVNIVGPFSSDGTDGEIVRGVAEALRSNGMRISTVEYRADGDSGPVAFSPVDEGDYPFALNLLVVPPEELGDYVMDRGVTQFENRYTIGYWRSDLGAPTSSMAVCQQMLSEIWVPSTFAREVVATVTSRNVITMAPVFDAARPLHRDPTSDSPFAFVASVDYAEGFDRQNPLGAISAYRAAFEAADGARLILETRHAARYPREHSTLLDACADRSDIAVIEVDGPALEVPGALEVCVVSLHRSEGTGVLLKRAMSARVGVIVTAHSLGSEWFGDRDSHQIPWLETDSTAKSFEDLRWAEPDLEVAARAMREVFEDSVDLRARATRAHERATTSLSARTATRAMRQRLEVIDRAMRQRPRHA